MYFPLNLAKKELKKRLELKKEVENWFTSNNLRFPGVFKFNEMAVLSRHVGAPRYEDAAFKIMAESVGLKPVWFQYVLDKMTSVSPYKKSLLHPFYCDGIGRSGGYRTKKMKLADISEWDGKRISEIETFDNRILYKVHNFQQDIVFGPVSRYDLSIFLKSFQDGAREYYIYYLAMFMAHGVLFEDYHGGESGDELDYFTEEIFQPAYDLLVRDFGVGPILVKMPWYEPFKYYIPNENWKNNGVLNGLDLGV